MAEIFGALLAAAIVVLCIVFISGLGLIVGGVAWALVIVLPAYFIWAWLWRRVNPR